MKDWVFTCYVSYITYVVYTFSLDSKNHKVPARITAKFNLIYTRRNRKTEENPSS